MSQPNLEEDRPSFFLYLVARIVMGVMPLSLVLILALQRYGIKTDILVMAGAIGLAYYSSKWYEQLSYEVMTYIEKKYR